eukprot:210726-Amphidinium_carterae.1
MKRITVLQTFATLCWRTLLAAWTVLSSHPSAFPTKLTSMSRSPWLCARQSNQPLEIPVFGVVGFATWSTPW